MSLRPSSLGPGMDLARRRSKLGLMNTKCSGLGEGGGGVGRGWREEGKNEFKHLPQYQS